LRTSGSFSEHVGKGCRFAEFVEDEAAIFESGAGGSAAFEVGPLGEDACEDHEEDEASDDEEDVGRW